MVFRPHLRSFEVICTLMYFCYRSEIDSGASPWIPLKSSVKPLAKSAKSIAKLNNMLATS